MKRLLLIAIEETEKLDNRRLPIKEEKEKKSGEKRRSEKGKKVDDE